MKPRGGNVLSQELHRRSFIHRISTAASTGRGRFRVAVALGYLVALWVIVSMATYDLVAGAAMLAFGGLCWELGRFARKRITVVTTAQIDHDAIVADVVKKALDEQRTRLAAFN